MLAVKLSAAKVSSIPLASPIPFASPAGTPPAVAPNVSSPAKSLRKTMSKLSESEGMVVVPFPANGSAYSDPSFVRDVADTLLLPADHKRLTDIGLVQSAEWSMAHIYNIC